jgi:aspartate racemase
LKASSDAMNKSQWQRRIGIVGGLGPHAHIAFENLLLQCVADAAGDQDYPPWVLSSLPATPDRTEAVLGRGPSPGPMIAESIRRIQSAADFVVIVCNTAHVFLDEIVPQVDVPILSIIDATLAEVVNAVGPGARAGLLATTGTLLSGVYPSTAETKSLDVQILSLLDLPDGDRLQRELVVDPIYGQPKAEPPLIGIKAGLDRARGFGRHRALFEQAAQRLKDKGADCIIAGCTEIPLALDGPVVLGLPLLDPMTIAAGVAIQISRGDLPLPEK